MVATISNLLDPDEARRLWLAIRAARRGDRATPDDPASGWWPASIDPAEVVGAAGCVEIDPRYRLVAYHCGDGGGNAQGAIYAVPATADVPEPRGDSAPPRPPGALDRIDSALIPSSNEPQAWFARSLLLRELAEIGALWHGVDWDAHDLLAGPAVEPRQNGPWEWETAIPETWGPIVAHGPLGVEVTFHTFSDLAQARILRHHDLHRLSNGQAESSADVLALGSLGRVP